MTWRGIFGVLAGFGAVLLLAGLFGLGGHCHPSGASSAAFARTLPGYNTLLHDRFFVGCALSSGVARRLPCSPTSPARRSCCNGSTACLPQCFSLVFGCISLGLVTAGKGGARLALVWPLQRVLGFGLTINLIGATALLITVIGRL